MATDILAPVNDHSSVFSKGGGGTVFEQSVETAYVVTLLTRGRAPGLLTGEVTEVAFQTTRLGFRTDDVLIKVRSHQGEHKLLAQIKHNLTISAKNKTFEEVLTAFWQDFTNPDVFNPTLDRLFIIKSELTQTDKRDTIVLLDWAKSKSSADDFYQEVGRIDRKKEALAVFIEVLQRANAGQVVEQERLWQFLRCMVILEYDFGQESSNSQTNFLNLIGLAKNPTCSRSEKEIWDEVFALVARLNKDGGSVTLENVQNQSFITCFDPARLYDSYADLKKLRENGQITFRGVSNLIDNCHLPRTELREELMTTITSHKLTVVIGEPGAGKSAITKEVIAEVEPNTAVFIFKADLFNKSHLSQVFAELGVHESVDQLFNCLAAIPNKLVVLDSFEKLLEADDPNNAFRQFMSLITEMNDIRVIATSRTYAVDLLIQKYDLTEVATVTVPLLSDTEFEHVLQRFPQLNPLAANSQINFILRSPKYLDFTVGWVKRTTEDISRLTVTEYKEKLWQHIVVNDETKGQGKGAKRRKAFLEIALLRARRMTLYAKPNQADDEALEALVNDNVLMESVVGGQFAPSHDILEDWALIKYIEQLYESDSDVPNFYKQIGNEPAFRRAFRLWVEESLLNKPSLIFQLVHDTWQSTTVEPYWSDELLIAIFRSSESASFFAEFEAELIQDHVQFLKQAIHLLRTACKERRSVGNTVLLHAVGSGWKAVLSFVQMHLAQLDEIRPQLIGLLIDWSYALNNGNHRLSLVEIEAVKHILFSYLNIIEKKVERWNDEIYNTTIDNLIHLTFKLTRYAQQEIKALIERAMPGPTDRYEHRPRSFYGKIRKMALSGVYSQPLTQFLPEHVISLARACWLRKNRPTSKHSLFGEDYESHHDWLDQEKPYGLASHLHIDPAGIYKTPILHLLQFNRQHGLNFVLEMVNYCTEHYVHSGRAREDIPIQINLILTDGTLIQQWGNHVLWQAYRATVVSSGLLESILMSLEKYLLNLAAIKSDESRENLQMLVNDLLSRSNSVAISSVLVSVAIAYPEEVGDAMLPLLSVKEFYQWDWTRSLRDRGGALEPVDLEIPFAQEERFRSNQLPHRKLYACGLSEFVRHVQFNMGSFNKAIHERFDRLKHEATQEDIYWRKMLDEIDIRKWEIHPYDDDLGGFVTEPTYEPDVQIIVDEDKPRQERINQSWQDSTWIKNVYEKNEGATVDYNTWQTTYNRFHTAKSFDSEYDRPVMHAIVGLRDLNGELNEEQRQWSVKVLYTVIDSLIQIVNNRYNDLNYTLNISPIEYKPALTSFPILLKVVNDQDDQHEVIKLLFRLLITYFPKHEMEPILDSLREHLWKVNPSVANHVWQSLIRFAEIRQLHEVDQGFAYQDVDKQQEKARAENVFINEMAFTKDDLIIDLEQIKFTTWHSHLLIRALMLLPFNTQQEEHLAYQRFLVPLFLQALDKDFSEEEWFDQRPVIYTDDRVSLQAYMREYFLYCNHVDGADMLELLMQHVLKAGPRRNDSYEFVQWTLRMMISELGQIVYNLPESVAVQVTANFWRVWDRFYGVNKQYGKRLFSNLLFLDIHWEEAWTHWIPLEGKKFFFKRITDDFAQRDVLPFINLLATVGDQTLLPDGLRWVVKIIKNHPDNYSALSTNAAEKLINRLFQRHIIAIKTDVSLLNDFIWLLDQMIDLGSSQAYTARENLITYKK